MDDAVVDLLAAARRRIRWAWAAATTNAVLPAACAVAAVVALGGWLFGERLPVWMLIALPVAVVASVSVAAFRVALPDTTVARAVERASGHDGVLVSALEFTDTDNHWHQHVQQRAAGVARLPDIARCIQVRADGRRLGFSLVAVALAVGMSFAEPFSSERSASAEDQAILDAEAERLEAAAELLEEAADSAEPPDEEAAELADELRRLADEIRSAESPLDAADELEQAAEALRERAGSDHLSQKAAAQGLEQQLATTPLQGTAGDAAEQFEQLAENLDDLSDAERDALIERLEALAASQAAGNPAVSDALQRAAGALGAGDPNAAANALATAADAQRATLAEVGDGTVASAAASAAAASANRLRNPGTQGDGSGNGQGDGDGSGNGSGNGQGNGSGSGQGQGGQGGGQANGGGPSGQTGGATPGDGGAAGQGGAGTPGANNSPEDNTAIDRTTIFDPAAGGASDEVQVDIGGGSADGAPVGRADGPTMEGSSFVPYRDVLPRYLADAAAALDELQLPPELRTTVRRYFDNLAER